jgi:hypothetical protein
MWLFVKKFKCPKGHELFVTSSHGSRRIKDIYVSLLSCAKAIALWWACKKVLVNYGGHVRKS